jgi:hypothetical protein
MKLDGRAPMGASVFLPVLCRPLCPTSALLWAGILLFSVIECAFAQTKDELTFGIGATVTPEQSARLIASPAGAASIRFDPSFAFAADYYHRLTGVGTALYGGISFAASPLDVITNSGPPTAIRQYAYLFLTPEVRVKFHSAGAIAPWLAFGGGYARFSEGALRNETRNPGAGTNRGTFQFGGGVDIGTPFTAPFLLKVPLALRLEVRDYYSGKPNYNLPTSGSLQHNILFAAGITLRLR